MGTIVHHTTHLQTDTGTILRESIKEVSVTVNSPSDFISISFPPSGKPLKIYCAEIDSDPPTGSALTVLNWQSESRRVAELAWSHTNRRLLLANETVSDSAFSVTVV